MSAPDTASTPPADQSATLSEAISTADSVIASTAELTPTTPPADPKASAAAASEARDAEAFARITGKPAPVTVKPPGADGQAKDGQPRAGDGKWIKPPEGKSAESGLDVKPEELEAAKTWVRRYSPKDVVGGVLEKLSPRETLALGKHFEKMQEGLDRAKKVGNTQSATSGRQAASQTPATSRDASHSGRKPADDSHAGDGSDTDPATPNDANTDLTPEQQALVDEIFDPVAAERLRKQLVQANTAEAELRRVQAEATAERNTLIVERAEGALDELVETFPELADPDTRQRVVAIADRLDPGIASKGVPSIDALKKLFHRAARAEDLRQVQPQTADQRRKESLATLNGQPVTSKVTGANPRGGMDRDQAAFEARKLAGSDDAKFRDIFNKLMAGG